MTPAAYAQVDLAALHHNFRQVRRCAPNAKIMAVIKANAYGHGMLRIANALDEADAFAVARVSEGVLLRKAGIDKPVLVLQGFVCHAELEDLLHYRLETVIHSPHQIDLLLQHAVKQPVVVWLKLDSGMNRLGFKSQAFNAAYRRLQQSPHVQQPIHLLSHFANADDLADEKTREQILAFDATIQDYAGQCSLANSAAIMAWQAAIRDWVRPGLMLFGCSPFAGQTGVELGLKPVMSLHSRLIAVKQIHAGETVGYSGTWLCERDTRLGVVAVGYGDGYPRYVKSGTPVLVKGQRVPLIGRVSMDMITVDLSQQPNAQPGDEVTLWGEGLAVEEIAECAGTIPYTLLCGITPRVQIVESSA